MENRTRKKSVFVIENFVTSVSICLLTFSVLFFKFDIFWALSLGIAVALSLLIFGLVYFSETFRCVMSISVIQLAGPQSRIVLMATVSGLLIGGPMLSIIHNLNEVQETTKCVANIVQSHSDEVRSAYTKAYKDMSRTIAASVEVWKILGENIDKVVKPVKNAFDTAANAIRDFEGKVKSVQEDCASSISSVRNKCKSATGNAFQDCLATIPSLQATVVKPVADFGQNVGNGAKDIGRNIGDKAKGIGHSIGDTAKDIGRNIGDGFKGIFGGKRRKRAVEDLQHICHAINLAEASCSIFDSGVLCSPLKLAKIPGLPSLITELGQFVNKFSLSVHHKKHLEQMLNSSVGNLTQKFDEIRSDFTEIYSNITPTFQIIQGILTIPLLIVPLLSFIYLRGAKKALSQKKKDTVDKFFAKDTKKERRGAVNHILLLVTHMLLTFAIIAFDYLLYHTQNVAREHGGANFMATGALQMNIEVRAGAVLQVVFDTFVKTLEQEHEQSYRVELSSEKCLPKPMPSVELKIIIFVAVLYLIMILSFVLQAFSANLKKRVVLRFLKEPKIGIDMKELTTKKDNKPKGEGKAGENADDSNKPRVLKVKEINKLNKNLNDGY